MRIFEGVEVVEEQMLHVLSEGDQEEEEVAVAKAKMHPSLTLEALWALEVEVVKAKKQV